MIKMMWTRISAYGLIAVGTCFMACATRFVYEPSGMVTGGFSGIAILLRHYVNIPLSVMTFLLNVPLFVWGYHILGREFLIKSLWGMLCFTAWLAILPMWDIVLGDYLLAGFVGATLGGIGLGIVMSRGGSTGGSDLLGNLVCYYRKGVQPSAVIAVFDGIVVLLGMLVYGVQSGLYSIVTVYIMSKVLDRMLEGFNFSKVLYIITEQTNEVMEALLWEMKRGVTQMRGQGGFTHHEKGVLLCVLGKKELPRALRIVRTTDEGAFVVIMDAREVLGEGFYDL